MNKGCQGSVDVLLLGFESDLCPNGQVISVASVCFGAGPAGGDYRDYVLEHNRERTEWALWIVADDPWADEPDEDDTGEPRKLYALQARIDTTEPASSEGVALELLRATWIEEKKGEIWETDFEAFKVEHSALLAEDELILIVEDLKC